MVNRYFKWEGKINEIGQISDINDLAELALYYRQERITDRKLWNEI